MKKFMLAIMAVVLAFGFSAFTTEKPAIDYYYWDGDSFEDFTGEPCEPGEQYECKRPLAGGGQNVRVLLSHNINDPLMTDIE